MVANERSKNDAQPTTWVGRSVRRKEDDRLLRGQGLFVDDLRFHNLSYIHFVRSPYGHARIKSIDVSDAEKQPGVLCTVVGEELVQAGIQPYMQLTTPPGSNISDYPLAVSKARFFGEPVAAVVAETRDAARDAADLITVEYEPLPAVVDGVDAIQPEAPVIHEEVGNNVGWQGLYEWGDIDAAMARADHVVEIDRLHFHRFVSAPLETNGGTVTYDPGTDSYTIHCNNQLPGVALTMIGASLGIPSSKIRMVTKDIGGAFGNKITSYTYLSLLAYLARKLKRAVNWTEYRNELLAASGHGTERTFLDIKVPVMKDGTILGFDMRVVDDAGAYLRYEPLAAVIWAQVVPGCYRLRDVRVDFTQALTNKCPTTPNRGYSRMQHIWMLERVVDLVAHELEFDPIELRKKNYIQPDEFPWETPNKCVYDSGDYPRSLDMALELIDYDYWQRQKASARQNNKLIGIGIGSTIDSGTNNFGQSKIINPYLPFSGNNEAANARLDLDGSIVVGLGSVPQGQSHETTAAQVVADLLGVAPDDVMVLVGHDMNRNAYSGFSGNIASQFAVTGIGAVQGATQKLRGEIIQLAAALLEASEDDIELVDGAARVVGNEERAIPFAGLAGLVHFGSAELPPGTEDIQLSCSHIYRPPFKVPDLETKTGNLTLTYASQVHACVVELDEETGQASILDYVAVDDSGIRINPQIVEGQVHGAIAHGIGAALLESCTYDSDGQLRTGTFYDYEPATSLDVPQLKTSWIETPSPFTPNGAKGMGEGGGAPLHTLCSAIQDALHQHGKGIVTDSYNPSERIYSMLHEPEISRAGLRITTDGRVNRTEDAG